MKYDIDRPLDTMSLEDKDDYARKIVALAGNDNFDQLQADQEFTEIYDLAVKYLDKELADEKESNWQKILQLLKN